MRKILTTLLILTSTFAYACTCHLTDIKKSYTYSSAIFYGKYLSTDTIKGFNDIFGRPFTVDNFEVIKFYNGIDSSTFSFYKARYLKYTISLINNCNDACGICFEKNQVYLVYAYRDFYSGHFKTDGCTRTRKITGDNFLTNNPFDPDLGKDENIELENLRITNTTKKNLIEYNNVLNFQKEQLNSQLVDTNIKLRSITIWFYLTCTVLLTIIIFLIDKLRQNKLDSN